MHELSIAASITESVSEFVSAQRVGKVLRVRLAVGELTCIQTEQLKFCYESIIRETALEGSSLEVEEVRARVRCSGCGYEGSPKYWTEPVVAVPTLQCPECGKAAEATQGHECSIKTIQYVS